MSRATRRKKKRVWPWILGVIGVVLLAAIVYGVMIFMNLTKTAKNMHEPIDREISEMRDGAIDFKGQEPFSMLVLGVDAREGDVGRSDTIIVLTVNPETNSTKMVSIPRDTYTEIVGKDINDKINHAFAFGGIEMALATVENFLDIPIDYVMQVNMESFKEIVDAVGGITVNNALDFKVGDYTFPKGTISMNGDKALDFVRMRKEDPRGDFGRQDRQKQVLQGVLREGASVSSLLNYKSIFGAIGNNVRTNLTFDEMVEIQKNYRNAAGQVDQLIIEKGTGETINKIWYYMMNDAELKGIQDELKEHLEL